MVILLFSKLIFDLFFVKKLCLFFNLTKDFLVLGVKTQYKTLDKKSKQFEQYEAKARLNLINNIFKTYDEDLNNKYKVELNKKTIDRVKNSF